MSRDVGMTSTPVLWALGVLLCATWCTGASLLLTPYDPPRITPVTNQTVISSGEDIRLKCEAKQPVHWTYPNGSTSDQMVNVTYSVNERGGIRLFTAAFIKHSAMFMDTGYYRCMFNGTDSEDDDDTTSIYVYVRGEDGDPSQLMALGDFIPVFARQYGSVTIPCRPTSPDVNVSLINAQDPVETIFKGSDVEFDPTIGFTLNHLNHIHSDMYECIATLGDNMQMTTVILKILTHTDYLAKPSMNISKNHVALVGDDITINCEVQLDGDVQTHFRWKIPNNDSRVQLSDAVLSKTYSNEGETLLARQILKIRNLSHSDEGNYNCTVRDHNGKSNYEAKYLKIRDADYIEVKLKVTGTNVINATAAEKYVQWVVSIEAFPRPEIVWRAPNGNEISPTDNKYNISTNDQVTTTILRIRDIEIGDEGTYQVEATNNISNRKGSDVLNLTLVVYDKPAVDCIAEDYYNEGEEYLVQCHVIGFPRPTVTWFFKECNNITDCDYRPYKELPATDYTQLKSVDKRMLTTLKINASSSGYISCTAINELGNGTDSVGFFVTDIGGGMKVSGPAQPVEGDNVTLSCGASVYNYSDVTWYWYKPDFGLPSPLPNGTDFVILKKNTTFSYQAYVHMINITKNRNADYYCYAKRLDDLDYSEETIPLRVQEMRAPLIRQSNMNGSEWTYGIGVRDVRMTCFADGVPQPQILWYKDNVLLNATSNHTFYVFGAKNQTLTISFTALDLDGTYSCEVRNRLNTLRKSVALRIVESAKVNPSLVSGIVVCSLILVAMIIFLGFKIRKERKLRKELAVAGLMHFEDGAMENINPELPVDEQADLLPYDKKWEFPRDKLKLGKQLGAGAFGVVLKADAWGIVDGETVTTVAVKMVKRNAGAAYIKALASELKIMVHLGKHLNVVNLLGACTKNLVKRELLVIVEYCKYGNLHNYLLQHRESFIDQIDPKTGDVNFLIGAEVLSRKESVSSHSRVKYAALSFSHSGSSRGSESVDYREAPAEDSSGPAVNTDMSLISMAPSGGDEGYMLSNNSIQPEWRSNYRSDYKGKVRPISTRDLLCWAFQVSRGMEYLSSRKVMHGDLAARNILLADDNIVKICDFGLAKSMYKSDNYKTKGDGPLPIKWMAIESIRDRIFSTQSDVWSFGIVLWELFTLSRTPYPGMEADEKLYNKLVSGYRMEQPQYATEKVYQTMLKCWETVPSDRPSFPDLAEHLGSMLEEGVRMHYIELNDPYIDMNTRWMDGATSDYLSMMNAPTYGNMMTPSYEDDGHQYVNNPIAPSSPLEEHPEASGYLCMKSPASMDEKNIFSPRNEQIDGTVFSFGTPQQPKRLRNIETQGADGGEMSPMLDGAREPTAHFNKSVDAVSINRGGGKTAKESNLPSETAPNVLNPNNQTGAIVPSVDNYVNMPQHKRVASKKCNHISEPANDKLGIIPTESFSNPTYVLMDNGDNKALKRQESTNQSLPIFETNNKNAFSNPNYQSMLGNQNYKAKPPITEQLVNF